MQEIYNAGWYATNEVCSWPVVETLYSVDGLKLSDSILSDLRVVTTGTSVFYLSGVQITDNFVSVVISSETGIAASVTLKQPVSIHRNYVLNTFIPGLSGTVAFGHGVLLERGSWHFAPKDNLLDGACIRLNSFPVTSLSLKDTAGLTGRVLVEPGTDLKITPCTVTLGHTRAEGAETTVPTRYGTGYKFELSADADKRSTSAATQTEILSAYAGPCQMRPENNDCPYITEINGVTPDQYGNINIKVSGDLTLNHVLVPAEEYFPSQSYAGCTDNGLYSNTILIATTNAYTPNPPTTPVRRCGRDLCDTDSSSHAGNDANAGSETISEDQEETQPEQSVSDMWGMRAVSQDVHLIPWVGNTGVVYVTETDTLDPVDTGPSCVYFSDEPHTEVYAVFELLSNYCCGIFYNLDPDEQSIKTKRFLYSSDNLKLGNRASQIVSSGIPEHTKVAMRLVYGRKGFTGTLGFYSGGEFLYTRELFDDSKQVGIFGLYMKNCKCLMWSEK